MGRMIRSLLVALLVVMMTFNPASAWPYCGGYGGGGYYYTGGYYGGGYYGCSQSMYYPSYYGGSCCGNVPYGGCRGEVVVSEGCSDCGACGGCACDGCACDAGTSYDGHGMAPAPVQPQMAAPEPPPQERPSTPSTVNRLPMEPAPLLPPRSSPSMNEMKTHAMPSTEPRVEAPATHPEKATPPPAAIPSVTPSGPPAEMHDDLFGPPPAAKKPLPAEEPSTPIEADDFFNSPAAKPATTPSSQPTDNDLFGPPAEPVEPAEKAAPPADEKPADQKEETDDLFGNGKAILELPGGLASGSRRHWVDNTGNFSCEGRLLHLLDGKVKLLKDNGHTTTVPLARLSQADLEFVNRQASAQQAAAFAKTAQLVTARSK